MTGLNKRAKKVGTGIGIFAATLFLVAILFPAVVHADDGRLGRTPEGVYLIKEAEVVMEDELIQVDLEKGTVSCEFTFRNEGESKEILMGFPGEVGSWLEDSLTEKEDLHIYDFTASVGGKSLKVRREKGVKPVNAVMPEYPHYDIWYTFTVPFKAGETVKVRNTYKVRFSYISTGDVITGYVLKTGASWKGPIGHARIEFHLGKIKPHQVDRTFPNRFRFEKGMLVWERSNFEPVYDLELNYNNWRYTKEFLESTAKEIGEDTDKITQKMDFFAQVDALAEKGDPEGLFILFRKALAANDAVAAQYAGSFLPESAMEELRARLGEIQVTPHEGDLYRVFYTVQGMDWTRKQLLIRHGEENGKTVEDAVIEDLDCIVALTPGVQYEITASLWDSLDRVERKTLLYQVPEQVEKAEQAEQVEQVEITAVPLGGTLSQEPQVVDTAADGSDEEKAREKAWGLSISIITVILAGAVIVLWILRKH